MQNLKLLKSLPSLKGFKYPKGFIFQYYKDECDGDTWEANISQCGGLILTKKDIKNSPGWFRKTDELPTHFHIEVNGDWELVAFKKGEVFVGCAKISNELVNLITKNLKK